MADNDRTIYRRDDGKWINKRHGNENASGVHDTQKAAEDEARDMLKKSGGGELITHGRDGKIRSKDTIGKSDPYPPKDTEH